MRILQSVNPRPLNLLAVGPGGLVVAASDRFGAPGGAEGWDARTGSPRWIIDAKPNSFWHLSFMIGGSHLFVTGLGGERLFALDNAGPPVEEARSNWAAECAIADDRVFVALSRPVVVLECRRAPRMDTVWKRDVRSERWTGNPHFGPIAAEPAGPRFAVGVREGDTHPKQSISVRDADTGAPLVSIPFDPASPVLQLAFTADGSKLVVRTDGRTVHLFDADTGTRAGELVHPGRPFVTAVAAHPGGAGACARTDGTVTFWDPHRREKLRTLDWKAGRLVSLAFGPDGALGAAGTEDGRVVVWDVDL